MVDASTSFIILNRLPSAVSSSANKGKSANTNINNIKEMTPKKYIVFDDLEVKLFSVFLTLWLLAYYHPSFKLSREKLSNIHSVPLCILALLSLQHILPESIPLCYSSSFFVVDIIVVVTTSPIERGLLDDEERQHLR